MNIAAKKLERLSPHKGTQQFIPTYVTEFDDTYEGEKDGQRKSTLVKHLNSERVGGGMKGFKKVSNDAYVLGGFQEVGIMKAGVSGIPGIRRIFP
eukprot:14416055-Ditylum_brightwellii.AAC.1